MLLDITLFASSEQRRPTSTRGVIHSERRIVLLSCKIARLPRRHLQTKAREFGASHIVATKVEIGARAEMICNELRVEAANPARG